MARKGYPLFFSIVLVGCLAIGALGNLTGYSGAAMLIVTILGLTGIRLFTADINKIKPIYVRLGIGVGLLVMLVVQIFILKVMPDTVYHDPYRVLSQADQMAAGHISWDITYFWRYSNNVPIAYLMSLWLRFTQLFSLSTNASIHILSIIVLDSFITLVLTTTWKLSHRNSTTIGAFIFLVLTPFAYTYYLQVFYTDLPTMLVLLIIMRTVMGWSHSSRTRKLLVGSGLVFTVLIGALLKPNIVVLLPALAIVALILARKKLFKKSQLLLPMVLITLGFGLSVPTTQAIYRASNYTPETTFAFPVTHWMLMGVNYSHHGMFAGHDVARDIALPNKTARRNYDLKHISKRVKNLGALGLMKLWVAKIAVLLNVQGIQNWYNGGFQSAPSWYQQHAQSIQKLIMISYTAATLVLWATLALRLFTWQPDLSDGKQVAALLAIITALGYLAFHTLLWEAEPRYGQAALPLFWFALAAVPTPVGEPKRAVNFSRLVAPLGIGATLLTTFSLATILGHSYPTSTVVAAQRSQLSTQYHAKPTDLASGHVMTEEVALHSTANYFSVQIHKHSHVQVSLENLTTHHRYQLSKVGYVYRCITGSNPGGIKSSLVTRRQKVSPWTWFRPTITGSTQNR